MAQDEISEALLLDAQRALQQIDPSAFLVWPRIVRRLILQDQELAGLGWHVPHRKCYIVSRERLLQFVAPDELGVTQVQTLPERIILISRPDRDDLKQPTAQALQTWIWRLLFHAHVHVQLNELIRTGKLTAAMVRSRVDRIGQAEFDEIRSVLKRENFLFPVQSAVQVYAEFVAVYGELKQFSPGWRRSYFPSVQDFMVLDEIIAEDINLSEIARATRLPEAVETPVVVVDEAVKTEENVPRAVTKSKSVPPGSRRADRLVETMVKRAERLAQQGNSVRAAIVRIQACQYASPDVEKELLQLAATEISRLTERLRAALEFDDEEAEKWRVSLSLLARNALHGFWNTDARLLYDLQKVCVDHEREVFVVDLVGWLCKFGRQPLRRPLPNQREVLMSKHLRSATGRLPTTALRPLQKRTLSYLLHEAARSAEEQLRRRLRPLIAVALHQVDLEPHNLPERVSRRKIIEELCDVVVHRGFLTIGNLRDSISRNNLKVQDLETFKQIVQGDQLLRADRELSTLLDGVYNPGEFYMRWLQRLSSLAFGTRAGRFVTQFVAIPFGGAVVILEGLDHLIHAVDGLIHWVRNLILPHAVTTEHVTHSELLPVTENAEQIAAASAHAEHGKIFMSIPTWIGLGFFIMALIHVPPFRRGVIEILRLVWKTVRITLFDTPRWLVKLPLVQSLLHSTPVMLFRRFLLLPAIATAGISLITLPFHVTWRDWAISNGIMGLALCIVLNSRIGRDLEEVSSEYLMELVHRIGVRFLLSLFELIMDTFKRIIEFIERVLYAVDEWLRFKSGESELTLILKAVLGVFWGAITFVIRFAVNLLIEPQINPIKHFPVVTVSHKIILTTMGPPLKRLLDEWFNLSTAAAGTLAGIVVFMLPGAVGFIVWELKENWRLFVSNRPKRLLPVLVGSHGETLIRLMKPGLHSGTLPKLFARLRRAERKAHLRRWKNTAAVYRDRLHHVEESVRHFIERDLCLLLQESRGWEGLPLEVGHILLASNSLRIDIECHALAGSAMQLAFEEQSGWLLASVTDPGWIPNLTEAQAICLQLALAGIYKIGGVDLIREQIEAQFGKRAIRYDISDHGLVVWPDKSYDVEVRYVLDGRRLISPRPRRVAHTYELRDLDSRALLYNLNSISWHRWVEIWRLEQEEQPLPLLFPETIQLLPPGVAKAQLT